MAEQVSKASGCDDANMAATTSAATLALWLVSPPGRNDGRTGTWTLRMRMKSEVRDEDDKWLTAIDNRVCAILNWIRFSISWTHGPFPSCSPTSEGLG